MSKATKRKHVTREVLEDYVTPSDNQSIVKVVCGRGNNLHEVESADGQTYLVTMPTKFRKNVWIKRGDYLIVEPIDEGVKVQAEIVHILYPKQIKDLIKDGLWPPEFTEKDSSQPHHSHTPQSPPSHTYASSSEDSDSDLFVNTNRQCVQEELSDSDSDQ